MKTARELGLNDRTYEALVAVRDKLRNGKFKYLSSERFHDAEEGGHPLRALGRRVLGWFNMNQDYCEVKNGECGQIGCIAGWLNVELGDPTEPTGGWKHSSDLRGGNLRHLMFSVWHDKTYGKAGVNPLYNLFYPEIDSDYWDEITPAVAANAIDEYLRTGDSAEAWPTVTGYDPTW